MLEFGDQQELFKTLLNSSKALDGAPYEVKFAEFNSGPLVNAGFTANRIDLGFMGDLPASLAVQGGIPVHAIAVAKTVGPAIYLVAKPGSPRSPTSRASAWRTRPAPRNRRSHCGHWRPPASNNRTCSR